MKTMIFDFNGTLLDDTGLCLKCINTLLERYDLSPIDLKTYRSVFTFPLTDYYQKVGFDFNRVSFEEVGKEWFELYDQAKEEYKLFPWVKEILQSNSEKGIENILLSASKTDNLLKQCQQLGIADCFTQIVGTHDIYGTSKEGLAKEIIQTRQRNEILFVGDTLHDYQVAQSVHRDCVLVADGHQSKEVLMTSGTKVVDHLWEVEWCV